MDKVNELRAARAGKVESLEALVAKMGAEDYVENEVDTQVYDDIKKDIGDLDKKISRAAEISNLKASLAKPVDKPTVFAEARKRYTTLKAFKGEGAEQRAYATGQWLKGVLFGDDEARDWCKNNGISVNRAHAEGVNSTGGFLVPTVMMDSIIDLRETFGVFRRNARVVPMASDTMDWPRRTGGLTAYFTSEGAAATESTAAWDNVALVAKKLAVLTRMSNELSEDAVVSIADILTGEIAYAFASKEDDCGFNGDGTSTYGGITGLTTGIIQAGHAGSKYTAAHNTFATLDGTDLTGAMGKLPQYALAGSKWYVSQTGFAMVFERLIAAAGGNSISTLDGAVQYRYLGFPVEISQKLPSTTSSQSGAVMMLFGNLQLASAMGERRVVTIKRSDDAYFANDQVALLGTERVDIVNHDMGDATNAGPIVGLVGS